jgi:myosin heavy subunit
MAKVGAKRAAELTGKSKSTIQRAMKNGKISYEVDDAGRRLIDVSELERAYGLSSGTNKTSSISSSSHAAGTNGMSMAESELMKARHTLELEQLKIQNKMLSEQLTQTGDMISDLKAQRDQWQKQAQQVLLTSQHSQKQSDARIAELREREEIRIKRAMQQKRQAAEQKARINTNAQTLKAENENQKQSTKSGTGFFGSIFGKKKSA